MGYIDDDTLAEAHGWRQDRPGIKEVMAAAVHAEKASQTKPTAEPATTIIKVLDEVRRATAKFPTWPTDPLHAMGVLHEEVGELSKEVLQLVYEPHKTSPAKVREEAIQAAAMALRFAMSLDAYDYTPGPQHAQA